MNGRLLAEPYLPAHDPLGPPIASRQHPYRVPPAEFYVLGDNRTDSCDSRYWGLCRAPASSAKRSCSSGTTTVPTSTAFRPGPAWALAGAQRSGCRGTREGCVVQLLVNVNENGVVFDHACVNRDGAGGKRTDGLAGGQVIT